MPEPPKRQCPYCGGWGVAQGTVYEVAGTAAQVLAASGVSESELERVQDALLRAQSGDATPDEVVAEVEQESPLFGGLLRLVVPRTPEAFWALVAALLMTIQLIQARGVESPPSREDVARIVAEALAQVGLEPESGQAETPPAWPGGGGSAEPQ
jgi:hypothetical protein